MRHYTVTVAREGNQWVAVARGLPKGVVGAMDFDRFPEVHEGMREVIADLTDSDPEAFDIEWRYEVNGSDVTSQVLELLETTEQLRRAEREQERSRREALAALDEAGLSQRAMADVVGVSHQRVNQLINH